MLLSRPAGGRGVSLVVSLEVYVYIFKVHRMYCSWDRGPRSLKVRKAEMIIIEKNVILYTVIDDNSNTVYYYITIHYL